MQLDGRIKDLDLIFLVVRNLPDVFTVNEIANPLDCLVASIDTKLLFEDNGRPLNANAPPKVDVREGQLGATLVLRASLVLPGQRPQSRGVPLLRALKDLIRVKDGHGHPCPAHHV